MVFVGCGRNTWRVLVGVGGTPKPFTLIILTVPFWRADGSISQIFCFLYTRQRLIVLSTIWNSLFDADSGACLSWKMYLRHFGLKLFFLLFFGGVFCTEGRAGRALFILIHTVPHKCTNETIHNNTWAGGRSQKARVTL